MDWSALGVSKMREKMELADYELEDIEKVRMTEVYPAGLWHELTMKFHFKRRAGWYILQVNEKLIPGKLISNGPWITNTPS
jgi:hypothetical protein